MPRTKRKDKSRAVLRTGESQRADGTYQFRWTDSNHKRFCVYANSLAAVHPELIAEWSEKNLPLTPDSITFGSNKKVWWKGACGHEWTAVLSSAALISFLYPAID